MTNWDLGFNSLGFTPKAFWDLGFKRVGISFRRKAGFTLIELLLSVFISALFISLIAGSLFAVLKGSKGYIEDIKSEQKGVLILSRLSEEIESAYLLGEEPFLGKEDSLSFVSTKTFSKRLAKIDYFLETKGEKRYLCRREKSYKYKEGDIEHPYYSELAKIESLSFLYFDGQDWKKEWKEKKLPKLIKINLTLPEGKEFTTAAKVYCAEIKLADG